MNDSTLISKGPCDDCGSSDACGSYDDAHTFCFSCGAHHNGEQSTVSTPAKRQPSPLLAKLATADLTSRNLSPATVNRWGVTAVQDDSLRSVALAFPYVDATGTIVAQKIKTPDKRFRTTGTLQGAQLFGQHLARTNSKFIVITEGELDAMSVDECMTQGNFHPAVVSIPTGSTGAKKALGEQLEWLCQYELVVLAFDMDEPGRKAVAECLPLFPPGKVAVAALPEKDANECLKAGKSTELYACIWNAQPHRPDGIVTLDDIFETALEPPVHGLPWIFPGLDAATYGRRLGELVVLGAGTGVGKTSLCVQQIYADLAAGHNVGAFLLENTPKEVYVLLAGIHAGVPFHRPDCGASKEDRVAALNAVRHLPGKLFLYDSKGRTDWTSIRGHLRYLNSINSVALFYLDNLTGLVAADPANEKEAIEKIMASIEATKNELQVWICLVSHLSRPEHGSHEEGARVTIRSYKGSSAIGFYANFMFGLERDSQADDPADRNRTTIRVLKDRYTGQSVGHQTLIAFNHANGRLEVCEPAKGLMTSEEQDF